MKRQWNWMLWAGFAAVLIGFFSYQFFTQFPITRDFPWVNFTLFGLGAVLLLLGLARAFGRPQLYRGKIFGSIFVVLTVLAIGLFSYITFFVVKDVPPSTGAPRVGDKAPEFTLADQNGKGTSLADLLSPNGAVLIFYRGFW